MKYNFLSKRIIALYYLNVYILEFSLINLCITKKHKKYLFSARYMGQEQQVCYILKVQNNL